MVQVSFSRWEKSDVNKETSKVPQGEGTSTASSRPGDGIRSLKTSAAFRALNFELYAKPNKTVMTLGLTCLGLAVAILAYSNYTHYDKNQYYEAINEDGSPTMRQKTNRWDA